MPVAPTLLSLPLSLAIHASACCDHLFPINCAMSSATLDFYCWPWSEAALQATGLYFVLLFFYLYCCLFFGLFSLSWLSRVKCGSYPVCCDIESHLPFVTIFQRQLELRQFTVAPPVSVCLCVCVCAGAGAWQMSL